MAGTIYPLGIDGYAQLPLVYDLVSPIRADDVNRLRNAVVAVETELGINPSSTHGTVRTRLDALEGGIGGAGGAYLLTDPGDLLTRDSTDLAKLVAGADGYLLIADSTQPTGLRWGTASGETPDFISAHIETPSDKEYFLITYAPFGGVIESITTQCTSGSARLDGYIDGISLGGSFSSVTSAEEVQGHTTNNEFSIGQTVSVIVSQVASCADLRFTIKFIRDNYVGNSGEANIGANVGGSGVGPYKQKVDNVLQFRNINAGSSKVSVTLDSANNEIDIDVVESALDLSNIGGVLPIDGGGTGQITQSAAFDALSPTTTKGDLIARGASSNIRLALGPDGYVLTADAAEPSGIKWADPAGGAPATAQYVVISTDPTLTQERVLTGTSGQIVITDGGAGNPVTIGLMATGVVPTSYTNPLLTIDGYGRIISASDGYAAPISAQYLTLALDSTLTNERVLAVSSGELTLVDGGANANATIGLANTAVTPGTYTTATITVDNKGRITAASDGIGAGGGANNALSNLTTTSINANLVPAISDGYDIGTNTLQWKDLYMSRSVQVKSENLNTEYRGTIYSAVASDSHKISFYRAEGTESLASEVTPGSVLGSQDFYGYDSASFGLGASLQVLAASTWAGSDFGTAVNIKTASTGSTALSSKLYIDGSGYIGIGNESPAFNLDVAGDGYFSGFVRVSNSGVSAFVAGPGAIRWGGTEIEFSDGSVWTPTSAGAGGANRYLSNLYPTQISVDLTPAIDDAYSLGTPSLRWKDGYFGPSSLHIIANPSETDGYTSAEWAIGVTSDGYLSFADGYDIQAEISLDGYLIPRSGLKFPDGTIMLTAVPAISASGTPGSIQFNDGYQFGSDAANLFWNDATNRLGVGTPNPSSSLHVEGDGYFASTITANAAILGSSTSTQTTPAFAFSSDENTGIYRVGADQIGVSTGGTLRWTTSTTEHSSTLKLLLPPGSEPAPALSFTPGATTGLSFDGVNNMTVSVGGTATAKFNSAHFRSFQPILSPAGNAGAPGISLDGISDLNTGFFSAGADQIGTSTGGAVRWTTSTTAHTSTLPILSLSGVASSPSYSFSSASDTGMYYGNDTDGYLAWSTEGIKRARLDSSGLQLDGYLSLVETPAAPSSASGYGKLYMLSSDSRLHLMTDAGVDQLIPANGQIDAITWAASTALNFATNLAANRTITLDNAATATTFTTSNLASGRAILVRVLAQATTHTLTFPSGWNWMGVSAPPSIAAGQTAMLSLSAYGSADTDVVASWAYENEPAGISGTGTGNRVAYWSDVSTLTASSNLYFDGTSLGVGDSSPTSIFRVAGSASFAQTTITTNTTLDITHHRVWANATSSSITVTLPAAASCSGREYLVKKIDATANTVTVDGNSAETIDSAATYVIATQNQTVTIQSDGSNWWVL